MREVVVAMITQYDPENHRVTTLNGFLRFFGRTEEGKQKEHK